MLTTEEAMKYANERKKSASSSNNSKGKEREKSEGSICFLTEDGKYERVSLALIVCCPKADYQCIYRALNVKCGQERETHQTNLFIIIVDQNFGSMDDIINPEYRNINRQRTSFSQVS